MFSYSSPELIDAEVRYRRERTAGDWRSAAGRHKESGWGAHRAWATVASLGLVRASARRHRAA
jgi:hypothetical protein